MSQENVEFVRRGMEAFVSGDWEAWFDASDPAIEWIEMPSLGPDASVYRGIDEVRNAVNSWISNWTEYTFDVRRYIDAGDEVVVLIQESGRGRSTGAMVTRELGEILTISDDGKLTRLRLYGSWTEALEAAGLSE
jgi:ketosteroid isomerase-like protein